MISSQELVTGKWLHCCRECAWRAVSVTSECPPHACPFAEKEDVVLTHCLMREEWSAWQIVVQEFTRLGIDMNEKKYDRLIKSITLWGEQLHALRAEHAPELVEKALADHQQQYRSAVAADPAERSA